mgnify:CR=1 FL=1
MDRSVGAGTGDVVIMHSSAVMTNYQRCKEPGVLSRLAIAGSSLEVSFFKLVSVP